MNPRTIATRVSSTLGASAFLLISGMVLFAQTPAPNPAPNNAEFVIPMYASLMARR